MKPAPFDLIPAMSNAATTEALRLEREREAVRKRATEAGATLTEAQVDQLARDAVAGDAARAATDRPGGGGAGGAGGTAQQSEFGQALADLRQEQAMLEAEAAALLASAAAGRSYADAIEFARTRAELLTAAQRDGQQVTPELIAQVDRLAQAHLDAGNAARQAADDMEQLEERGKRGAEALTGTFVAILDGSKSAKQAVADLLMQMAEARVQQTIVGAMGGPGDGVSSWIGGMLGFANGGYTGHGGKYEPAGVVHRGEYVLSKAATSRLGVGNLDALHNSALRGYATGGLVGEAAGSLALRTTAEKAETPAQSFSISAPITVNANGGTPEQNEDLARQVARESEAMFRGLVQQELTRQMRPGGMLR
ncbi:phage tail tape measure protein [Mangrovicoccus ximenensis]|uniref:hypothetical protein n=1 Tax=Mangrovicoccus ximenensis TaxID=1911570 RepID=UPI000D39BA4E